MKLQKSNEMLAEANEQLAKVQTQVDELNAQLARLQTQYDKAEAAKKEAEETAERGKLKLDLASRLIAALGSEGARWTATVSKLEAAKELLDGDVLLASAFISYIGPFTKEYREELIASVWMPFLEHAAGGNPIPMTRDGSPLETLAREADIAEWNTQGLPFDPVSSENGAIVCRSVRWPLIIDPQLQGIAWLKKMESPAARHLALLRLGSADLIPKLTKAIENGWTVIIENIGERIDAVLMPVLARTLLKRGSNMYVQLGDQEIEFSPNFQLYLHTKLSNPHYPPEIQAELTLVNFTVTPRGLEDQLLSLVVRKERPDLASKKAALVQQANKFMITIRRLEDEILMKLANAEGDITEDVGLIEGLESAKKQTDEAAVKLEEGRATTEDINTTSEKYRSVARQGSLLFFIMNSLHRVHTYYIYSLNAFVVIFQHGIELVKKASDSGKGGGKMSMMAKLKSAAKQVIQTQRFHWGTDLLHGHSQASDDDHAALSAAPVAVEELTDEQLELRCTKLKDSITTVLYNYMRRGLFERDKLTVASMLTFSVLEDKGGLNHDVLEVLMQDRSDSDPVSMSEELEKWLPLVMWRKIKCIEDALGETVPVFQDLADKISSAEEDWHTWYDLEAPETEPLPGGKEMAEMGHVEKMVILRALRADRVTFALKHFINESMGSSFVTQPPFDMKGTYQEASASTPIFFVLFPGVDPTPWVEELGASFEVSTERGNFVNISMGQGQEKPAEATLERMAEIGGWVMLQNVHLMQSWLPIFERKLELASEHAHPSFRCFISAEPPPTAHMKNVPEALLQSCIKVANEAPADLKSNMRRSWATFSHERIAESESRVTFQGCLFGLCYFHSVMLGRKKFGQQGWSRSYGFNTGDLDICANVLQSYLESYESVPWQDLRYLFGEIFYGGHITDFWDRRTNVTYLEVIFREATLLEGEPLPHKLIMPPPGEMNFASYSDFIEQTLPTEAPPPLMGLHPNAEIGYLTSTTNELFTLILRLRAGSEAEGGGGGDGNTALREIMEDLHEKLPKVFDMVDLNEKAAPLLAEEGSPYVLVALQECTRFNLLLSEIDLSLENLRKGLNGQLNMSQSMEDLMENLSFNMVPGRNPFHACSWEKLAWPSLKNLASWFADLVKRVEELGVWVGVPDRPIKLPYSIWISMLFNSTAFLTAVKQVTARKEKMPLDNMTVETHVTLTKNSEELDEKYPTDGCFIHGLFMQGARWPDKEEAEQSKEDIDGTIVGGSITESRLKDLLPAMPVMYVRAVATKPEWDATSVGYIRPDADIYNCPVYNSTFRGTFVFLATLKTKEPTSTWVLGGVALIMQTDD
jgi:dynein heavy chain